MVALASETGWTEDFIYRRLPWSRLLMYRHAQLFEAGHWTVEPGPGAVALNAQAERLLAWKPKNDGGFQT